MAIISVQEAEQTRQYVATQVGRLESLHVDDRRFEEVTRSLFYPEIFSRQEQVEHVFDGIESSYDWIFDKPRTPEMDTSNHNPHTSAPLWDDFARWLSSGHGIYWVNGKAGSGKSTLMNHICSHKRRIELLQEWSPHRQLLTPSFFFWNSGSPQQKTIDGLLRSLIYQMLTKCHQLIACFKVSFLAWLFSLSNCVHRIHPYMHGRRAASVLFSLISYGRHRLTLQSVCSLMAWMSLMATTIALSK